MPFFPSVFAGHVTLTFTLTGERAAVRETRPRRDRAWSYRTIDTDIFTLAGDCGAESAKTRRVWHSEVFRVN